MNHEDVEIQRETEKVNANNNTHPQKRLLVLMRPRIAATLSLVLISPVLFNSTSNEERERPYPEF